MRKMRSDSTWNQLGPEQRARFEGWLFDENVSYAAARARAEQEFGVAGSVDSVARYYRARRKSRELEHAESGVALSRLVSGAAVDAQSLREASEKMLGLRFLEATMAGGSVSEMCAVGRLMLRRESTELHKERMELARGRGALAARELELEEFRVLRELDLERAGNSTSKEAGRCG